MAMKIRCTECAKKISIDEAFAGGVCRCPYCSALVFVGGGIEGKGGRGMRPATPTRRPSAPGVRPEVPTPTGAVTPTIVGGQPADLEAHAKAQGQEHIPLASPVKIQGIVTLVLLGLLLLMLAGIAVAVVMILRSGHKPPEPPPPAANPFVKVATRRVVAGDVRVNLPVIYLLDAGGSMSDTYSFGVALIQNSIRTLEDGDQFNIFLCREDGDRKMSKNYRPAAPDAADATRSFLENVMAGGATDLSKSLSAAIDAKPGTIVLFSRKSPQEAVKVAEQAKAKGVLLVSIALDAYPSEIETLRKMTEAAGGEFRSFGLSQMEMFIDQASRQP